MKKNYCYFFVKRVEIEIKKKLDDINFIKYYKNILYHALRFACNESDLSQMCLKYISVWWWYSF